MPVISRFYGMIVKMYFRQKEHNPPHIHVIDGEKAGTFNLCDGEMSEGDIHSKEQEMIKRYVMYYKHELLQMWETQEFRKLEPIE